jgi:hypothetical protein
MANRFSLSKRVKIPFPAEPSFEFEEPPQTAAPCVVAKGLIDNGRLRLGPGHLHGSREGFVVQVERRSH